VGKVDWKMRAAGEKDDDEDPKKSFPDRKQVMATPMSRKIGDYRKMNQMPLPWRTVKGS
jgi:hypothetical protein